ncbi:unnamed protein product, partial [marine sediment metagenome]
TGDLQMAFDKQYEDDNSVLDPDWRLRAHNQFLSFFIAFGVFGFLYCVFALFAPIVFEKKYYDAIFIIVFFIGILSFLNEDTLETHIGATFFFGFTGVAVDNIKDASVFISHIRFSLMVNVAIFILALFVFDNSYYNPSGIAKIIFIITLFWLIIFIGLFQTLTGIVIFIVIGYFMVMRSVILIKNLIIRYLLFVLLIGIVPASLVLIYGEVVKYYDVEEIIPGSLALYTSNNNIYHHDLMRKEIENGKYVWIYICEDEIREEWNKRSELNYSGYDHKGQEIKYTLVRFLTSKG